MVEMGAMPERWDWLGNRYVEAWLTVRRHVYREAAVEQEVK